MFIIVYSILSFWILDLLNVCIEFMYLLFLYLLFLYLLFLNLLFLNFCIYCEIRVRPFSLR